MKIPEYVKPAVWGAIGGAIAMSFVGFSWGGWTTAGTTERMARERADTAVVTALVPYCLAKAQLESEGPKLVKFRAENSSYSRSQIVRDAGWATASGMTSPDGALASACAEKLQGVKAS